MGNEVEGKVRRGIKRGGFLASFADKKIRTGASSAARESKRAIAKQQQKESARLAEATSAVATAEATAKSGKGGRKSLLKTSPGGLAINLGGTNA